MMLTSEVDIAHRKQQEKKIAKKRKNEQPELLKKRRGRPRKVLITSEQLPATGRDVAAAPQTPQLGGAQANFGGPS